MIQRIAVFLASLTAVAILVVGLSLAGVSPGSTASPSIAAAPTANVVDPSPAPVTQVDTVYVAPPQKPATVVVHKTVAPAGGEQESESESGGD